MSEAHGNIRIKFTAKQCLSGMLKQLGWASFNIPVHDAENLPAHVHPDAFEICYINGGSVEWWVEDKTFLVKAGDVFITLPGEKHGGLNDIMNPCQLYWVQVVLPEDDSGSAADQNRMHQLKSELLGMEQRVFTAGTAIERSFKSLIAEHQRPDQFSRAVVQAELVKLLAEVIRSHAQHSQAGKKQSSSAAVQKACSIIETRFANNLRMDDVADEIGLSTTSFYRQFADQMHEKPSEYLARIRIEHAKQLLRNTDRSITDIAHSAGYSSSQYFATIFKHSTGLSPRQYRQSMSR